MRQHATPQTERLSGEIVGRECHRRNNDVIDIAAEEVFFVG